MAPPAKKPPPHGTHLTPTMCVAVSTQSGTHTSTQSCWGNGGGPRGGPWPPPPPPPLTEAVIPVATDSTRHSDQRGGKIGQLLPRIFCLPRASKLAFNFCSASAALWWIHAGSVSRSLQLSRWWQRYSRYCYRHSGRKAATWYRWT